MMREGKAESSTPHLPCCYPLILSLISFRDLTPADDNQYYDMMRRMDVDADGMLSLKDFEESLSTLMERVHTLHKEEWIPAAVIIMKAAIDKKYVPLSLSLSRSLSFPLLRPLFSPPLNLLDALPVLCIQSKAAIDERHLCLPFFSRSSFSFTLLPLLSPL